LPKPNYQFEKRQRDLAKKQKQEEKRRQKLAGKTAAEGGGEAFQATSDGVVVDSVEDGGVPEP
jgi:hypothetical protein